LAHGGAGSNNDYSDGTQQAASKCLEALDEGESLANAVGQAVAVLEDDSRFNAGVGSHLRLDGSAQMDAAIMDSAGNFGAVAAIEGYKNPIHIAQAISKTQYRVLVGPGAAKFAGERGLETLDLKNIPGTGKDFSTTDTVGCVAYDGENFACGLSTGGIKDAHPGRVGDVPLIGCGLYAGPQGALAATGSGEAITTNLTAYRAYQLIEQGMGPEKILEKALTWFDPSEAFGLLIITREGFAGGANRPMAWSVASTKS